MARLRYNGLRAELAGSGLTSSGTTVTFAAALTHSNGTNVPTITGSDYVPLAILDTSGHLSEIVWLTAYTATATTGTITRGKEGTTGVAHSSGDAVVGAVLAADIVGDHGARVKKDASGQTITNQTVTALTWQTENWDTDGYWTSGASTRLTIPAGLAGRYLVGASLTFDTATVFDQLVSLGVNGTELESCRQRVIAGFAWLRTSTIFDLAAGDYVEAFGYQGSGSSKATPTVANVAEFWLQRLA